MCLALSYLGWEDWQKSDSQVWPEGKLQKIYTYLSLIDDMITIVIYETRSVKKSSASGPLEWMN